MTDLRDLLTELRGGRQNVGTIAWAKAITEKHPGQWATKQVQGATLVIGKGLPKNSRAFGAVAKALKADGWKWKSYGKSRVSESGMFYKDAGGYRRTIHADREAGKLTLEIPDAAGQRPEKKPKVGPEVMKMRGYLNLMKLDPDSWATGRALLDREKKGRR